MREKEKKKNKQIQLKCSTKKFQFLNRERHANCYNESHQNGSKTFY